MLYINRLIRDDHHVYVAFSGGKDSLAAAAIIRDCTKKQPVLIHVNHCYHESDDKIELQVRKLCQNHGFLLDVMYAGTKFFGKGSEADCHDIRYSCFHKLRGILIIAHHLDDYVESYLLGCFKGQPLYLPPLEYEPTPGLRIVRPFALTEQTKLTEYLRRAGLEKETIHDPLNDDKSRRRYWIRNIIRPQVELKYPGLQKTVRKLIINRERSYESRGNQS